MIIGIGCDIINIARIKTAYDKYGIKFLQRSFTKLEIENAPSNMNNQIAYYAKRFAAKEAYSKALGTGIGRAISFLDIEVKNYSSGKPYIVILNKIFDEQIIHLSLSDEQDNAIAYVVIEKRDHINHK